MLKIFQKSMRACLAAVLVCLLALTTNAQNKTVTGKVTDAKNGSPLVGATVSTKPSGNATATKSDGSFSLSVKPGVTKLVISFTGYADKEIAIDASGVVNLTMEPNAEQLQDVIVVGYGTRKLKDATGSVSSIGPKSFNKGVISSPENLFQGRVAGVNVTTASGEPGGAIEINIRGTNSIRSNNNPLIVIDGVPLYGGGSISTSSFGEGNAPARNPLSFINPDDIENISILKDASSAAIYGSRGANGVILITTKSGKGANQGIKVTLNTGVSSTASRYKVATSSEFVSGISSLLKQFGVPDADIAGTNKGSSTDWQDQIFQTGVNKNLVVSWGTSTDEGKTSFRLSGSYDDIVGIVKNSGLRRITLRSNFNQDEFLGLKKLKLDYSFTISNVHNEYPGITNNAGYQGSLIGAAIAYNPTFPIYNSDGTLFDSKDGNRNPVAILQNFKDFDNGNTLISNLSLTYKVAKNITYKATFGNEVRHTERNGFASPLTSSSEYGRTISVRNKNYDGSGINGNGLGIKSIRDVKSDLLEHTLNYDNNSDKSAFNLILGYSFQSTEDLYNEQQFWGLEDKTKIEENFAKYFNNTPIYYTNNSFQLQSFFGRANLTLSDKYYFTGTLRADGSSKLSLGNKYGYFPALAFKWKILNEGFAEKLSNTLDNLDLRLQYGKTGNQEFPTYASLALSETDFTGTSSRTQLANPDLTWETTTSFTAGIDFSFLKGIVRGNIDIYNKTTKDLLFFVPFAQPAPARGRWDNLKGNVVNTGIEIAFDIQILKPKISKSLGWDINLNFTTQNNKVQDLPSDYVTGEVNGQGLSGAYAQIFRNGYPLFTWYMPTFKGYDANGFNIFANPDPTANDIQGSALPTYFAGITNNFTFGRWSASIFINAVGGNYIYNNTANALFLKGALKTGHNVTSDVISSVENGINIGAVSTRFLEKGDFIRLQNLNINYSVPVSKNKSIKSFNISLSGQNLFLITSYTGLDPEVNVDKTREGIPSRGFDYTAYPKARTITLGINIGF